jgi:hypothetical protein
MKVGQFLQFCALLLTATLAIAQSQIAGKWQATERRQPVVILDVSESQGKLAGTAIFYLFNHDNNPPTVVSSVERQLVSPSLNGNVFSFQVKSLDASSGEMDSFKMRLTGKDEALLRRSASESEAEADIPEIRMIRQK